MDHGSLCPLPQPLPSIQGPHCEYWRLTRGSVFLSDSQDLGNLILKQCQVSQHFFLASPDKLFRPGQKHSRMEDDVGRERSGGWASCSWEQVAAWARRPNGTACGHRWVAQAATLLGLAEQCGPPLPWLGHFRTVSWPLGL
jgi:hypothetical protein